MPGRTGIELLEAVRATQADLPFVLFTGRATRRSTARRSRPASRTTCRRPAVPTSTPCWRTVSSTSSRSTAPNRTASGIVSSSRSPRTPSRRRDGRNHPVCDPLGRADPEPDTRRTRRHERLRTHPSGRPGPRRGGVRRTGRPPGRSSNDRIPVRATGRYLDLGRGSGAQPRRSVRRRRARDIRPRHHRPEGTRAGPRAGARPVPERLRGVVRPDGHRGRRRPVHRGERSRRRAVQGPRRRTARTVGLRVRARGVRRSVRVGDVESRLELARQGCTTEGEARTTEHLDAVAGAHGRMRVLIEGMLTLAREGTCVTGVETERTIRADASRVQQLLENLIRNAVEYGGSGVTVTVGDLEDGSTSRTTDRGSRRTSASGCARPATPHGGPGTGPVSPSYGRSPRDTDGTCG